MVKEEYLRASVGTQVWGQDLTEGTRSLSTLINGKFSHRFWKCRNFQKAFREILLDRGGAKPPNQPLSLIIIQEQL